MSTRRSAGFTLIELMLVMAILGGMTVLLAPHRFHTGHPNAQATARIQMRNFEAAIERYEEVNRKPPASLEALAKVPSGQSDPYIDEIRNDPWDHPFEYRVEGKRFKIRSYGPDGRPDTEDDLVWPVRR